MYKSLFGSTSSSHKIDTRVILIKFEGSCTVLNSKFLKYPRKNSCRMIFKKNTKFSYFYLNGRKKTYLPNVSRDLTQAYESWTTTRVTKNSSYVIKKK